ncbi:XylDLEGF operon transcriptional activator 1 [Actinoplanes sp. SE50]|uniref:helix-turn-helix transcriptional regulator n=1 Tax=unclassified Actinoplanes TaxID=2626549 RepID=UPI00023EC7B7|nr:MULTISPECIES: AraC family transcriptional regulator [unclassified Actinoplanes]AEV84221.1 XylDLEGF operon transcriptional activator 1 [Actinoplanes sp. SE50/110]ATO82613.1 XylDLEGF operon transcriptional activator 1 [Actinoplanes sp. SE50]SLM00020.1 AraC family transcriptional regulator [Actinoplanes sp. SE50/110]
MKRVLSATGHEDIEQLLRAQYLTVRLRTRGDNKHFMVEQNTAGPVTLGHAAYGMSVDMAGEPIGALVIGHVRSGSATYVSRGRRRTWGPGDVFLGVEADEPFTATLDHLDSDFVIFDPATLSDVACTAPGVAGPVRLEGHGAVSPRAAARFMRTVAFLHHLTDDDPTGTPGPDASPLVALQAARLLASVTLDTFASNAMLEPTIEDRHDVHPATVRRAVAFIESHPDLDLSVVDIARAAFVTTRALQLAFRRHLGTTPLRYLRRVRLDRAHADLLAADPAVDTVTAIAARWGWARPSRFAADYRAAHGRHPHQTLRS